MQGNFGAYGAEKTEKEDKTQLISEPKHFILREKVQHILIQLLWVIDLSTNIWVSYYFYQNIKEKSSYFIASLSLYIFGHLIIAFVGYKLISVDVSSIFKKIAAVISCLLLGSILPSICLLGPSVSFL